MQLQQVAKQAGFNLQPVSSFRDFERQRLIWNTKFYGERKVHDDQAKVVRRTVLDDWQSTSGIYVGLRCLEQVAIIGERNDIFDPDLLPKGQNLTTLSLGNIKLWLLTLN